MKNLCTMSLLITFATWMSAGCTPAIEAPPAAPPAELQPVDEMLSVMAETEGISEDDAKAAAVVVCERLWGKDPKMQVTECKLEDETWNVLQWADGGISGWGCRVFITKDGTLKSAEYVPGQ
jgi:hypothetical protein